jgi:hypothetical protein
MLRCGCPNEVFAENRGLFRPHSSSRFSAGGVFFGTTTAGGNERLGTVFLGTP